MAGRRYASDVSVDDQYDRREYTSRNGRSRGYEERYVDEEVDYRRGGAPVRERDVQIREEVRERPGSTPAFMRDDYGRTTSGPMVLRARETEDFEFVPRPRRRSPSAEPERKVEKEEIIIRRDEAELLPPPTRVRERSRDDREEIIVRRGERDGDRRAPPRDGDRDREEIIIRREERDDMASRRGDYERRPPRDNVDREEIIIRRGERDSDDRDARSTGRRYDDRPLTRPISHERERSRVRRAGSDSEQEIIIRTDEREGRSGDRERTEVIIRKHSHSRSPSPSLSSYRSPPEPPVIRAPPIHQEIITHHRHIDHGYEIGSRSRPISRPPSPPMPPLPRERSEERIEIHRSGEKNGRTFDEDIVIDRNESRARSPLPPPARDPYYDYPNRREPISAPVPYRGYDRDLRDEADYYNGRAMERAYVGEGYNGATRDWGIVDVPPGTRRVRMDGAGGGTQEVTWQTYNGVRRSQFMPEGGDEGFGSEVGRPLPPPAAGGEIGGRFGRVRDPTDGLWTEITKDLVVKEAIKEMGYEYEETDDFYYVIAYLRYEDVARLVGLSDDIRKDRRYRMKEMDWENRVLPPPLIEEPTPRLAIEAPPALRPRERDWDREEERYVEREIVYRGGRPPPPPEWRR